MPISTGSGSTTEVGELESSTSAPPNGSEVTTSTPSDATSLAMESSGSAETTGEHTSGDSPPQTDCGSDLLRSDTFSPNEVYLIGTLSEGACYLDAIAHWSTPSDAVVGLGCYFNEQSAVVRPTDGRMLYTDIFGPKMREFHCDDCPWVPGSAYPDAPFLNDIVLNACEPDTSVLQFLAAPDGSHMYHCNGGLTWYAPDGTIAYESAYGSLRHLGVDSLGLTDTHVVGFATQTATEIVGLPSEAPLTIRAAADGGFFLVVGTDDAAELWHVDPEGAAASLGSYGDLPMGYHDAFGTKLDGCGGLYQFAYGPAAFEDVIVRRHIGRPTEIIYTEAGDPVVKIHISGLLTGP